MSVHAVILPAARRPAGLTRWPAEAGPGRGPVPSWSSVMRAVPPPSS